MKVATQFLKNLTLSAALLVSANAVAETIEVTHAAGTIEVTHAAGTTTVETQPQRVVVLGLGSLDVLDHIGVEPIGVVKSFLPDYLSKYQDDSVTNVGSLHEPDFETIFTLKPDLIIASSRTAPLAKDLSAIAPTIVFQIDGNGYWESAQENWRMLGEIFEKEAEVESYISQIQADYDAIRADVTEQELNALTIMTNGSKLTTFGSEGRFSTIYTDFGFAEAKSGITQATHGNLVSFEYIASANPDVMFVLDRDAAIGKAQGNAQTLLNNDLVHQTPAAQDEHLAYLNTSAWYLIAGGIGATKIMINDVRTVLN
uniref:siderophore ABC transporter substrate-binding protein n=1 Tax=Thaumasiovibrio occultus TaxID=1891184 RepID=UPI000B361B51|nr:ABC transporter substrate-binding protein [Thaumasiovibrio occultus]